MSHSMMSLSDESEWDSGEEEDKYVYDDWPDHKKPKFIDPETTSTYRPRCWRDFCAVRPRVSLTESTQ